MGINVWHAQEGEPGNLSLDVFAPQDISLLGPGAKELIQPDAPLSPMLSGMDFNVSAMKDSQLKACNVSAKMESSHRPTGVTDAPIDLTPNGNMEVVDANPDIPSLLLSAWPTKLGQTSQGPAPLEPSMTHSKRNACLAQQDA